MWNLSINRTITKYCFDARTAYHIVTLRKTVKASSVRRIFERGGQKIWEYWRPEWKFSNPKPSPFSCPKLGEDQKQTKGLHSNLVRFLAQNYVKAKTKVFAHRFCAQTLCPSYKRRDHVAILHTILCKLYYPGDPNGGGHCPMAPLSSLVKAMFQSGPNWLLV